MRKVRQRDINKIIRACNDIKLLIEEPPIGERAEEVIKLLSNHRENIVQIKSIRNSEIIVQIIDSLIEAITEFNEGNHGKAIKIVQSSHLKLIEFIKKVKM